MIYGVWMACMVILFFWIRGIGAILKRYAVRVSPRVRLVSGVVVYVALAAVTLPLG